MTTSASASSSTKKLSRNTKMRSTARTERVTCPKSNPGSFSDVGDEGRPSSKPAAGDGEMLVRSLAGHEGFTSSSCGGSGIFGTKLA